MLPLIEAFIADHHLPTATAVANAGMISDANQEAIEAAGLSFILAACIPRVPYVLAQCRRRAPGQEVPHGAYLQPAGPPTRTAAAATRSYTAGQRPTASATSCTASMMQVTRPREPRPQRCQCAFVVCQDGLNTFP